MVVRWENVLQLLVDEITADVFDVLMSISNFEEFKLFMLSYKQPTEDMQRTFSCLRFF